MSGAGSRSSRDADEALRSTTGRANFQRVTRLLISGGTRLLRDTFDSIYPPIILPLRLNDPAVKNMLKAARLTKPQWDCLYPSPGVYGKSTDFDITLLSRLLRTICLLSPPPTGWDNLPNSTDHSLTADLVRVKFYRNSVYGHVNENMEILDDDFPCFWKEISETLVRIAGNISMDKKDEWQKAIKTFLKDPLTPEDERNVDELMRWYTDDMNVKKSIEELKIACQEGARRLGRMEEDFRRFMTEMKTTVQEMKDHSNTPRSSSSLTADLENMEIPDEIREILVQTAGDTSIDMRDEWKKAINRFLKDPLTPEDERNLDELIRLYTDDINVKKSIEELKIASQEGARRLGRMEEDFSRFMTEMKTTVQEMKDDTNTPRSTSSGFQSAGGQFCMYCPTVYSEKCKW